MRAKTCEIHAMTPEKLHFGPLLRNPWRCSVRSAAVASAAVAAAPAAPARRQHRRTASARFENTHETACLSAKLPQRCRHVAPLAALCDSAAAAASGSGGGGCSCGIVIVDHGSRRAASNDMLVEFCTLYAELTGQPIVQPAHMEIAEPTIAQAIGARPHPSPAAAACCRAPLLPQSLFRLPPPRSFACTCSQQQHPAHARPPAATATCLGRCHPGAAGRCVAAGARRVIIAPYFLSRGRHIQDDIPALVAEAQQQYPDVACSIAEPIGERQGVECTLCSPLVLCYVAATLICLM